MSSIHKRPRVCAVSYLNTVPLVWGIEHGAQRDIFDLNYALPSECADQLASGEADIGIVPVIEMARQQLDYFRGTGIACRGPVRSILLVSKVPLREIKTLATDLGSRTSVMLARIVLSEKYGVQPKLISRHAELAPMLGEADGTSTARARRLQTMFGDAGFPTKISTNMGVQAMYSGTWTSWMWTSSHSLLGLPKAVLWYIHNR